MAGLLDIGPLTEEVVIRGSSVTVQGLGAGHMFQLFSEFPAIRRLFEADEGNTGTVFLNLAPELIARIIAIATGGDGDKKIEAMAARLGAADQLAILNAVQRLSFPGGIGPFVLSMQDLMGATIPLPASMQAKVDRAYDDTVKRLLSESNASLQTDTPKMARGRTPRVSSAPGAN